MVGLIDQTLRNTYNSPASSDFSETKRRLGNMWDYLINQSDISKGIQGTGQAIKGLMTSPTISDYSRNPTEQDVANSTNAALGVGLAASPIPAEANTLKSFGGIFSKLYPGTATNKAKANMMWKQGANPDEMLAATGLMPKLKGMLTEPNQRQGFPGLLHYMPDTNSELNMDVLQKAKDYMNNTGSIPPPVRLADIINKPDLYKAYPHLQDRLVEFNPYMSSGGRYNPITGTIIINPTFSHSDIFDTLNHEIQHATAHIEGWPWGAGNQLTDARNTRQFVQKYLTRSGSKMTVDDIYKSPLFNELFAEKAYPHAADEVMARLAERTAILERRRKEHLKLYPESVNTIDPINMSDALMSTLAKIKHQYPNFNQKDIIYDAFPALGIPKGVP